MTKRTYMIALPAPPIPEGPIHWPTAERIAECEARFAERLRRIWADNAPNDGTKAGESPTPLARKGATCLSGSNPGAAGS